MFSPFPPVRGALGLLRGLGTAEALRLAHLLLLPAGVMAEHLFRGDATRLLLLGNAMHADVPIDAPASGVMGYLLIMMAQDGGFPVPVGGAGQLTAALVRRAESAGARVECGRPVTSISVSGDRATAVRTADGASIRCRRAVIADTSAPELYQRLLPLDSLPASLRGGLDRFVWDTPVLKVNYALDSPIPWRSKNLSEAGTVHLGADHDGLIRWMADLNTRTLPERPFLLFGQMTTSDPTRSAAGTESAWAYSHLPRGLCDDESAERLTERIDRVLEEHAPGFGEHVVGKVAQRPSDLENSDANLHTGAVNGGTSQLFQQLIFQAGAWIRARRNPLRKRFSRKRGRITRRRRARSVRTQRCAGRASCRRRNGLAAPTNQSRRTTPVDALSRLDVVIADRRTATKLKYDPSASGAHWDFPERQVEKWPRERSIEHKFLTLVFGTSTPPKGLSGKIRRIAY